MKVVVSFHGACMIVHQKAKNLTDVLLLNTTVNSPSNPKSARLYHHPLLMADKAATTGSTALPVADIAGLVDQKQHPGDLNGWYLSGLSLKLGVAGGTVTRQEEANYSGTHPASKAGPWTDWRWIANLNKISPTSVVESEYMAIGKETLAIIRLEGGTLRGATPIDPDNAVYTYSFSPAYQQAITDRFEFEFDNGAASLDLPIGLGSLKSTAAAIHLQIVNEAPPAEIAIQKALLNPPVQGGGQNPATMQPATAPAEFVRSEHFVGYYEAITKGPYHPLAAPIGAQKFDTAKQQDTAYCPPTFIEVP